MRRKIIFSIILMIAILIINVLSYANNENTVNLDVTKNATVSQKNNKVELIISLGDFGEEIPSDAMMGYEAIIEYDEETFPEIKIEGLNEWSATYYNTRNQHKLIGETKMFGNPNVEIAKVTLTLAEGVNEEKETFFKIKEGEFTIDGDDELSFEFEYTVDIKIEPIVEEEQKNDKIEEEKETSKEVEKEQNTNQEEKKLKKEEKENVNEEKTIFSINEKDETVANKIMPQTGLIKILCIFIITTIAGISSFIKYRTIKIK